jgi:uncharacterized membrane protein YraQ (UPF0718 family)
MIDLLTGILLECWDILLESAPFVLFGFFAAGVLKAVIPGDLVARHLGRNNAASVVKASLFGVPLPLCSCGVIPAAVELRKQGASKGSSAAFLVSVPETGVDSIAITYALLDPLMTVLRPLAAFITATVTGLLINRLPEEPLPAPAATVSCSDACCGKEPAQGDRAPLRERLRSGLGYAFGELLADIGSWLMLGIAIAGVIAYAVPEDFFARTFADEWTSLLVMLLVGIPLYICASASTPVAAALVLKGLSPGAALVFLLAGPATNAATLTVVYRFWGRGATAIYLSAIALCSLLLGWLTNRLYAAAVLDILDWVKAGEAHGAGAWEIAAALLLLALLARCWWPRPKPCPGST